MNKIALLVFLSINLISYPSAFAAQQMTDVCCKAGETAIKDAWGYTIECRSGCVGAAAGTCDPIRNSPSADNCNVSPGSAPGPLPPPISLPTPTPNPTPTPFPCNPEQTRINNKCTCPGSRVPVKGSNGTNDYPTQNMPNGFRCGCTLSNGAINPFSDRYNEVNQGSSSAYGQVPISKRDKPYCGCPNFNEKVDSSGKCVSGIIGGFLEVYNPVTDRNLILSPLNPTLPIPSTGANPSNLELRIADNGPIIPAQPYTPKIWKCKPPQTLVNGKCETAWAQHACNISSPIPSGKTFSKLMNKKLACCLNEFGGTVAQSAQNSLSFSDNGAGTSVKFDCIESKPDSSFSDYFDTATDSSGLAFPNRLFLIGVNKRPVSGHYTEDGVRCDDMGYKSSSTMSNTELKKCPYEVRTALEVTCPVNPEPQPGQPTIYRTYQYVQGGKTIRRCSAAAEVKIHYEIKDYRQTDATRLQFKLTDSINGNPPPPIDVSRIIANKFTTCPTGMIPVTTNGTTTCKYPN